MPAKKKPAKRVNWKQYASHCEWVIDVLNDLARRRETRLQWLEANLCASHLDIQTCSSGPCPMCERDEDRTALDAAGNQLSAIIAAIRDSLPDYPGLLQEKWQDNLRRGVSLLRERAEAAEKHNAILLAEREVRAKVSLPTNWSDFTRAIGAHEAQKLFQIGEEIQTPSGTFIIGDPDKPLSGGAGAMNAACCKESLCRGGAMERAWQRLTAWAKGIRQRNVSERATAKESQ